MQKDPSITNEMTNTHTKKHQKYEQKTSITLKAPFEQLVLEGHATVDVKQEQQHGVGGGVLGASVGDRERHLQGVLLA